MRAIAGPDDGAARAGVGGQNAKAGGGGRGSGGGGRGAGVGQARPGRDGGRFGCARPRVAETSLCPAGAGLRAGERVHGLRSLEDSLAAPMATARRPFGTLEGA